MESYNDLEAEKLSSLVGQWITFLVVCLSLTFSVLLVVILVFLYYFVSCCYYIFDKSTVSEKLNK